MSPRVHKISAKNKSAKLFNWIKLNKQWERVVSPYNADKCLLVFI